MLQSFVSNEDNGKRIRSCEEIHINDQKHKPQTVTMLLNFRCDTSHWQVYLLVVSLRDYFTVWSQRVEKSLQTMFFCFHPFLQFVQILLISA